MPPFEPDREPATLGELRALGIKLALRCLVCNHSGEVDPVSLRHRAATDLAQLARRMRCMECNRVSGGMSASPADSRRWIAYLRRTGQHARIPPWAKAMGCEE